MRQEPEFIERRKGYVMFDPSVIGVTGQRPHHMRKGQRAFASTEVRRVVNKLTEMGAHTLISGLALGVDQWAAREALRQGLQLWAYLPFPSEEQSARWNDADIALYESLLYAADDVKIASEERPNQIFRQFDAYGTRNQMIVDTASVMIVVTNGSRRGGTWDCINRVIRRGSPIILIDTIAEVVVQVSAEGLAHRFEIERAA